MGFYQLKRTQQVPASLDQVWDFVSNPENLKKITPTYMDFDILTKDLPQEIYQGMIIGEHSRENDLEVNRLKGKKLTNVRASGSDEAVRLTTPITLSLEEAIAYIDDDELVEVTPNAIRLRKRYLDPHERKRQARAV